MRLCADFERNKMFDFWVSLSCTCSCAGLPPGLPKLGVRGSVSDNTHERFTAAAHSSDEHGQGSSSGNVTHVVTVSLAKISPLICPATLPLPHNPLPKIVAAAAVKLRGELLVQHQFLAYPRAARQMVPVCHYKASFHSSRFNVRSCFCRPAATTSGCTQSSMFGRQIGPQSRRST